MLLAGRIRPTAVRGNAQEPTETTGIKLQLFYILVFPMVSVVNSTGECNTLVLALNRRW